MTHINFSLISIFLTISLIVFILLLQNLNRRFKTRLQRIIFLDQKLRQCFDTQNEQQFLSVIVLYKKIKEEYKEFKKMTLLHFIVSFVDICDEQIFEYFRKIIKIYIDNGNKIDELDMKKQSPLFCAIWWNSLEVAQLLINSGADLKLKIEPFYNISTFSAVFKLDFNENVKQFIQQQIFNDFSLLKILENDYQNNQQFFKEFMSDEFDYYQKYQFIKKLGLVRRSQLIYQQYKKQENHFLRKIFNENEMMEFVRNYLLKHIDNQIIQFQKDQKMGELN